MAWFLCSTSRSQPKNWPLCKEVGLFAVTLRSQTRADSRVDVGDHLLFWVGGKGYSATGVVTGKPRRPRGGAEAPWPGGTYNYRAVIPFDLDFETKTPLFLPFVKARQTETGFASVLFQRGLTDISEEDAKRIVGRMNDPKAAP